MDSKATKAASIVSIDLRDVPVYVLSANADLPQYTRRREIQRVALNRAGFSSVTTVYGIYNPTNVVTACSLGHALLIETALTQLLPFRPFLILEDDTLPEDNVRDWDLCFPSDADAVYPSMASDSADLRSDEYVYTFDSSYVSNPTIGIPGANLLRVYNMLTSHACLVLSLPWALNWLRCAIEGATRKCGFDVLTAYTMKKYQVYAQPKPWFYQAEIIGGKEFETRLVLSGILVSSGDDVPDPRLECVSRRIADIRSTRSSDMHANSTQYSEREPTR